MEKMLHLKVVSQFMTKTLSKINDKTIKGKDYSKDLMELYFLDKFEAKLEYLDVEFVHRIIEQP